MCLNRISIIAKTLCEAHTEEKRQKGTLPDRGHIHENERNLGKSEEESEEEDEYNFIYEPPNDGPFKNYCLLLSLIMARAKQISKENRKSLKKKHYFWDKICRTRNKTRKKKTSYTNLEKSMKSLLRKSPELKGNKLDIVIPKFCEYFPDVNVFVICPEFSLEKFKYTFPPEGAGLDKKYNIFLYQEPVTDHVYHVKFIDAIKQFAIHFGGLECIFGCGKVCKEFQQPHGDCKFKTCDLCKFPIVPKGYFSEGSNLLKVFHCDGLKDQRMTCIKCKIEFGSKLCFDRHKFFDHGCSRKYKCQKCKTMVYPKKNSPDHKCGVKTCFYCKSVLPSKIPKKISQLDEYESIHQCAYKPAKLPNKLPNLAYFTLAIGEENSCINCQKKNECKLHKNLETTSDIEPYAVAMAYEFKNHEEFLMKKWIDNDDDDDDDNSEYIGVYSYLTKSVQKRRSMEKKELPRKKTKMPSRQENRMKNALKYVQKLNAPIWRFLRYILNEKFNNYVFVCDSDTEMSAVLSELKKRNIPMKTVGKQILIHITAFNIRIISRQRFIAGKLLIIAKAYGIDFDNIYFSPVM